MAMLPPATPCLLRERDVHLWSVTLAASGFD